MKEAYAVRRTVPPSAEIEEQIENLLAVGVGENPRESLSELARLGARLIIQRAVEDEFDAWLGRARYERRSGSARGPGDESSALRNGFRPRRVHTLEGELEVDIPQARQAAVNRPGMHGDFWPWKIKDGVHAIRAHSRQADDEAVFG
jgi:Transposase, Mutator family